jgi:hypothetical protein
MESAKKNILTMSKMVRVQITPDYADYVSQYVSQDVGVRITPPDHSPDHSPDHPFPDYPVQVF